MLDLSIYKMNSEIIIFASFLKDEMMISTYFPFRVRVKNGLKSKSHIILLPILLVINSPFLRFPLFENFSSRFPIQIYEFDRSILNVFIKFVINKMVVEAYFRSIFFGTGVINRFWPGPINSAQTHWARLAGSINNAVGKLKSI